MGCFRPLITLLRVRVYFFLLNFLFDVITQSDFFAIIVVVPFLNFLQKIDSKFFADEGGHLQKEVEFANEIFAELV